MARSQWEAALFELEFPYFTLGVRRRISELVAAHKCSELDDIVIDGLWAASPDGLAEIIRDIDSRLTKEPAFETSNDLPSAARNAIRNYVDRAYDYEAELADLDAASLEARYKEKFGRIEQERRAQRRRKAQENDRWDFFNKPEAEADFEHWRSSFLTPAQIVALSMGKNPVVVTPDRLQPFRPIGGSLFREEFRQKLEFVEAAVRGGNLDNPTSVGALVAWAATCDFALPSELLTAVHPPHNEEVQFWKERCQKLENELNDLRQQIDNLHPKSKASVYRLILGMAVARFEHTTGAKSDGTKAIKGSLDDVGLSLGPDVIRDWLRDAALHLDFERTEPIRWNRVPRAN